MRVDEAKAALERAGYEVRIADGSPSEFPPGIIPALFDVEGLARDLTEGQLISMAHRHGAWGHAAIGAHRAGPL